MDEWHFRVVKREEFMAQPADEHAKPEEPPQTSASETRPEAHWSLPSSSQADSVTFSRCANCRHATDVNSAAGTLVCAKHNMFINAEADEIPDDCAEHEPKDVPAQSP